MVTYLRDLGCCVVRVTLFIRELTLIGGFKGGVTNDQGRAEGVGGVLFSMTGGLGETKVGVRAYGTCSGLRVGGRNIGVFHGGVRRRGCDVDTVVGACGDVAGGRQDDTVAGSSTAQEGGDSRCVRQSVNDGAAHSREKCNTTEAGGNGMPKV